MQRKASHIRTEMIYCPHCQAQTEQGVWVQEIPQLNKIKEYADCLTCDNTDTVRAKVVAGENK